MGAAALAQALRGGLKHQPGGNRDPAQLLQVRAGHHSGIDVRQQPGRLADPPRTREKESPALSLTARPGDGGIRGRRIAILLAPGVERGSVTRSQEALAKAGAVVRLLAARLGAVETTDGLSTGSGALPATILFLLVQKRLIGGLTQGAVKG